ncbi:ABC transporter ATP-binding protein [Candidatus Omnitrophota bacterium]
MQKSYLKTIYYFLSSHKLLFAFVLTVSVLVALLEYCGLAALWPVFNSLLEVSAKPQGAVVLESFNRLVLALPFKDKLTASLVILVILILLRAAVGVAAEFLNAFTSGRVMYDSKKKILKKYSGAPYQFFLDTKQGEPLYNIINAPARLAQLLYRIPRLILESLKVIAIVLFLLYLNVYVTLIFILLGVGFNLAINSLSNRFSYVLGKKRVNLGIEQTSLINEVFNGIKQIIVYGVVDKWRSKFDQANRQYIDIYVKDISWIAVPKHVIDIFGYLAMFSVIIFVKKYHHSGFMNSLPVIGIFAMALVRILPALGNIGRLRMEIMGRLPDAETIYRTFNKKFEKPESGRKSFAGLQNKIALENVYFAHKERQNLINGLNIAFKKNQVTAIVGATGSGKTTIINLILGLFRPSSGRIRVDGVDLQEYDIQSWRERIGFVSQDAFIFHSTIAENISFGADKYTEQDIEKAAQLSGADEFIQGFPERYQTIVGERGMKLSGGQQQRIAIARAIIRRPEILILDEATSAFDSVSERVVQQTLKNIFNNQTIIIIAHRLSTVQDADKIIVIKDGLAVESGKHTELLQKNSHYGRLYEAQVISP